MFPGLNPRKMKHMMKQLGVKQEQVPATEVIIKTQDKELVFPEPQVAKVDMMGQETYQITGKVIEKEISSKPEINEDDIKTVAEQANVSPEQAKEALERHNGDIAASILELTQQ